MSLFHLLLAYSYLTFCLLNCSLLVASEASRARYLQLIDKNPDLMQSIGDATRGEIEILVDPDKMAAVEATTGRDVGVFAQDTHWFIWLNEACKLPNGNQKVMSRIVAKNLSRCPGVGVLPVLPDGRIVLNCEFRHATRSWELEMPRGGVSEKESLESAARRELLEETGFAVESLVYLGEVAGDSGVTGMILPIYMGKVSPIQKCDRELDEEEVIDQNLTFSIPEIKEALLKGYLECTIKGASRRVHVRDPFLVYALMLMDLKQLHAH